MTPRLIACWFPDDDDDRYRRMAAVLERTAREHCVDWSIEVVEMPNAVDRSIATRSHAGNTQKLDYWADVVAAAADGDQLLLIDADTFITRPVTPVWDQAFDVAYTVRLAHSRLPLNGGVVFVRVNERSRAFIARWAYYNRTLLANPEQHRPWKRAFGGINQASLGWLLSEPAPAGLQLRELPCLEWNCEDTSWEDFDPAITRIVHVKSGLRRLVFGLELVRPTPAMRRLVHHWRALDRDVSAV